MSVSSQGTTVGNASLLHFIGEPLGPLTVVSLAVLLFVVLLFDLRRARIPDFVILAAYLVAAAIGLARSRDPVWIVSAGAIGFGIPLYARTQSGGRIGWGDVKLSFVLALAIGPVRAAAGLLLSCLLALAGVGLSLLLQHDEPGCESGFAFGPYLVAGALMVTLLEGLHGL